MSDSLGGQDFPDARTYALHILNGRGEFEHAREVPGGLTVFATSERIEHRKNSRSKPKHRL